jgi:hypothetical protein
MSDQIDTLISDLRLFNEKADRLTRTKLSVMRETSDLALSVHFENGRVTNVAYNGPDDDSLDAFVLTVRLFLQNNERISFGRMSVLYSASVVPAELREAFELVRSQLNSRLDSPTPLTFGDARLTFRAILDVFLYGGLAHANRAKNRQFEQWRESIAAPFLHAFFVQAVGLVQSAVLAVKAIYERTLLAVSTPSA